MSRLLPLLLLFATVSVLLRAEDGFFDSDGVKIHYTVAGSGPPVLLIHGFTASISLNWGVPGVIKLLTPNYKVIALDNRGHGQSAKPENDDAYGAKMAEDSIRLLDHLKIQKVDVVGYSMGGMIAMKLMAEHPDRVKSAVVGGMGWTQPRPGGATRSHEREDSMPNAALAACLRGFPEFAVTKEKVMAIKTPMVVIVGEQDGLLQRSVKPLESIRPDIPVVIVPGANHASCIFKPEFREEIKKFLDAQNQKPG